MTTARTPKVTGQGVAEHWRTVELPASAHHIDQRTPHHPSIVSAGGRGIENERRVLVPNAQHLASQCRATGQPPFGERSVLSGSEAGGGDDEDNVRHAGKTDQLSSGPPRRTLLFLVVED